MIRIYFASKTEHAGIWKTWRDHLRGRAEVVCTWIDEAGKGETLDWADLWSRCVSEAVSCDVLIVYARPGDELKGAYVEVGAALGAGRPVIVVGAVKGSWVKHALVRTAESIEDAVELALAAPGRFIPSPARAAFEAGFLTRIMHEGAGVIHRDTRVSLLEQTREPAVQPVGIIGVGPVEVSPGAPSTAPWHVCFFGEEDGLPGAMAPESIEEVVQHAVTSGELTARGTVIVHFGKVVADPIELGADDSEETVARKVADAVFAKMQVELPRVETMRGPGFGRGLKFSRKAPKPEGGA